MLSSWQRAWQAEAFSADELPKSVSPAAGQVGRSADLALDSDSPPYRVGDLVPVT